MKKIWALERNKNDKISIAFVINQPENMLLVSIQFMTIHKN